MAHTKLVKDMDKKGRQTKRLFPNNIKDILGGTFIHLNAQTTSRKGLWKNYTSN